MRKFFQIISFLTFLLGSVYAHSGQMGAIEKHIKDTHLGDVYGIQVIFDSLASREKSKVRHIVFVWGGYDRGWCSPSGSCGCATNTSITWLKLDGKSKAIDSRKLSDDCKGGDRFDVGFSDQFISLSNSKNEIFSPIIVFDTHHPDRGFQESGQTIDLASKLDHQHVSCPTEVENGFLSPGFSCSNAKSFVEVQICSSMKLSQVDRNMAELYRINLAKLNAEERAGVRVRQIEFIRNRSSCTDIRCIEKATIQRIEELSIEWDFGSDRVSE